MPAQKACALGIQGKSLELRQLCMAALQSCTAQWQDPRDMLQTSSWRCSTRQPPQHLLFAAVAAELQPACQLRSRAQKVSSKAVASDHCTISLPFTA